MRDNASPFIDTDNAKWEGGVITYFPILSQGTDVNVCAHCGRREPAPDHVRMDDTMFGEVAAQVT